MGKKRLVAIILLLVSVYTMKGQTTAEEPMYLGDEWVAAFSEEGRKNWTPEFTLRCSMGFCSGGPLVTGGVRIDDKRTLGLMLGQGDTYFDAVPGSVYHIESCVYIRRYFHFGKRHIVSLYSDIACGASWVYKVKGKYWTNSETGERIEMMEDNPGDIWFYAAWEPGIRIRFYKNLHFFLGPTLATDRLGFHLGVGF